MRKFIAVFLIILGIALISYPKLKEYYCDIRQQKLLEAWDQSLAELEEYEENYMTVQDMPEIREKPADSQEHYLTQYIASHMEGILKIDKIKLQMPILKGATKANLNISVSSLEGTSNPGEIGNYCISAHRSRTYGRQFNRLHELENKDQIEIVQKDAIYIYEVFEKLIVEAEDTWVLLPREKEKLLTLITCDYSRKPYPRLVVRARLLE